MVVIFHKLTEPDHVLLAVSVHVYSPSNTLFLQIQKNKCTDRIMIEMCSILSKITETLYKVSENNDKIGIFFCFEVISS